MTRISFKNVLRACRGMHEAGARAREVKVANGGSRDELLRQDLPALTGLRFVAAFSVLIGHGFAWILADHETPGGLVFWVSQISGFGMTLFFVPSGFAASCKRFLTSSFLYTLGCIR